jgi:hypothetical protein
MVTRQQRASSQPSASRIDRGQIPAFTAWNALIGELTS